MSGGAIVNEVGGEVYDHVVTESRRYVWNGVHDLLENLAAEISPRFM